MNDSNSYHKNVPVGEWVKVPKGMMAAPNTYIDRFGVLRDSRDHSCVMWHNKGCERRGTAPDQIVYDPETNAPWCPDCWAVRMAAKKKTTIAELFDQNRN